MIGVSTILSIRQRCANGDSIAQIARDEGVSEPTVRKYRDIDDLSPELPARKERGSKLDPYVSALRHAPQASCQPRAECGGACRWAATLSRVAAHGVTDGWQAGRTER